MLILLIFIAYKIAKNMQMLNVFSMFSKLKAGELRDFSRFVRSPFFNGRNETVKYYNIVKKFYPGFDNKNFTAENIFQKMYPGKKFNMQAVRRLNSYLLKLLKDYLSYKGLKNDPFYFDLSLSIQLSERRLYKQSHKQLVYTENKYSRLTGDYEFYFWKRYLIERHKNSLYSFEGNDHLASEAIIKRTEMFANHTAAVICKSLISLFINEKNFGVKSPVNNFYDLTRNLMLDNYIKALEETKSEYYPVIAAEYYQAMSLLDPDNEFFFAEFKKVIETGLDEFSYIEKINFYTIFEAVCTLKIEKGELKYSRDLFEAYIQMLDKGLYSYTPGGEFILRIFRNIVHTAAMVKETVWLEKFIGEYTQKLPADSQKSMGNLAEAVLYFESSEFSASLQKLNSIDFELFHFKIDIKNLQVKLYYELGYTEELISAIDAYRHFISGSKFISERYRSISTGFVNNVSRLVKLQQNFSEEQRYFAEKDIMNTEGALYREWLLEKLNKM